MRWSSKYRLNGGTALDVVADLLSVLVKGARDLLVEFTIAFVDESDILVVVEGAPPGELRVAILLSLDRLEHLVHLGRVVLHLLAVGE